MPNMEDEDVLDETEDLGQPAYEPEPEDIEVVVSDGDEGDQVPDEFKDLSKAEIVARLRAVEEKAAKPPASGDLDSLKDTLEKIASRPVNVVSSPPPPLPPPKAESLDELKEKYGERFVTDPIGVILELGERKNGPQTARSVGNNLFMARKLLEMDPKTSENFKKYATQIDQLVAGATPEAKESPMIYEQAYKMILAQNVDAIVNDQVEAKVSAKVAELVEAELKKRGISTKSEARPVSHAESRGVPRPQGGKIAVKMEKSRAERLAMLGIDVKERVQSERAAKGKK